MQKKNSELKSKNTSSEDGDFNVSISVSDFRLLTFINNSQVIGLYVSEDDKNIFVNNPRVIATRMMPYDTDSIGLEAFAKANLQAISLPNVNIITKYIETIAAEMKTQLYLKETANQEPFPTTQWSYLTEGPLITNH